MASEAGEAGVICTSLAHIADLLLDHGDPILAVGLAGASDRRLRQVGGATTAEMSRASAPIAEGHADPGRTDVRSYVQRRRSPDHR